MNNNYVEKELHAANGMGALIGYIALYLLGIAAVALGGMMMDAGMGLGVLPFVIGLIWVFVGWLPLCGLKILKPQEALVLTLFGKYVGTLKGEGFFWVNPFCSAVNPAAQTKLKQSGDVDSGKGAVLGAMTGTTTATPAEIASKKMSLKIMTLNNARQKVNDCLGNPVEIGIAVMWRVVDTAKAAFAVDNYKEYLSLQCDSALRNIVRI